MFSSTGVHPRWRSRMCATCALSVLFCLLPMHACADEVREGVLQLRWGDAARAAPGSTSLPPQFEVWLDAGPRHRYRLDADQARRAAGEPDPFRDPAELARQVDRAEAMFERELARQAAR